jgi:hypothetical protein
MEASAVEWSYRADCGSGYHLVLEMSFQIVEQWLIEVNIPCLKENEGVGSGRSWRVQRWSKGKMRFIISV